MKNRSIAAYSLYLAIFLIFGLVPNIGYIQIGAITVTTMALPIVLIAIHKGWRGALFGVCMFGVTSAIGLTYRGAVFIAALGVWKSIATVFLARLLIFIPLFSYLYLVRKLKVNSYLNGMIIAFLTVIFNTIFVLTFLAALGFQGQSFLKLFAILGITNILPEWIIMPFIGIFIGPLGDFLKKRDQVFQAASYN